MGWPGPVCGIRWIDRNYLVAQNDMYVGMHNQLRAGSAGVPPVFTGCRQKTDPVQPQKGKAMKIIIRVAVCLAFMLLHASAAAQRDYPAKPIRVVTPNAAGGPIDILARLVGERMGARLGQPLVVEGRPGAFGFLATETAIKAAPDGYTLLFGTTFTESTIPFMVQKVPYDNSRPLQPVALLVRIPFLLLVPASSQARTLKEVVQLSKSKGAAFTSGSQGPGSLLHLTLEMVRKHAGIGGNYVPYKAAPQIFSDLANGQLDFALDTLAPATPFLKGGRIRAIAMTTAKRSELVPDLPGLEESGLKDIESIGSLGIMAPPGTPVQMIDVVQRAAIAVVGEPAIRRRLLDLAYIPDAGGPDRMAAAIRTERERYLPIVKELGLRLD